MIGIFAHSFQTATRITLPKPPAPAPARAPKESDNA